MMNPSEKNKYQRFLEEISRNSLITSKDTTPFSIPTNYEISEDKRKPIFFNSQNLKSKAEETLKQKEHVEVFNFLDKNSNPNEIQNVIHQLEEGKLKNDESHDENEPNNVVQMAPFTFKETQPKLLIQTPKGLYKNVNPFIISSARLPETQKILNSFRNDPNIDVHVLEVKNSATSNKGGTTCLICFDKLPDAVFMECGHGGYLIKNSFIEKK